VNGNVHNNVNNHNHNGNIHVNGNLNSNHNSNMNGNNANSIANTINANSNMISNVNNNNVHIHGSTSGPGSGTTAQGGLKIVINSGDNQVAAAGSAVLIAPSIKVIDGSGAGVQGVKIVFVVTSGGGSVTGATATTDQHGVATVGSWTLGTTPGGTNTLTVIGSGLIGLPLTFTATVSSRSIVNVQKSTVSISHAKHDVTVTHVSKISVHSRTRKQIQHSIISQDIQITHDHHLLVQLATNADGILQWTVHFLQQHSQLGGTHSSSSFAHKLILAIVATMRQLGLTVDATVFSPFRVPGLPPAPVRANPCGVCMGCPSCGIPSPCVTCK
jgi:hypothetical protein